MIDYKKYERLDDLPKYLIILLACYAEGGAKVKVNTEVIAYRAFKLKKSQFSWTLKKYDRFPDLRTVHSTIDVAKGHKLLTGSYSDDIHKDGWILTNKGLVFAKELSHLLKLKKTKIFLTPIEKKVLKTLIKNEYFKKFSNNYSDEINIYEFSNILGASPGNHNHLRQKFFEIRNFAKIDKNEKILDFLRNCRRKFPSIINEKLWRDQNKAKSKKAANII
tara:strand:- start:470 stop:1129 length:660 start_codon:yes stop_codon:yes gene_type:complete